jgi:hypothetical protein
VFVHNTAMNMEAWINLQDNFLFSFDIQEPLVLCDQRKRQWRTDYIRFENYKCVTRKNLPLGFCDNLGVPGQVDVLQSCLHPCAVGYVLCVLQ